MDRKKLLENWYQKYGPSVHRRCRFLLKQEEMAIDATQEVFVKVLNLKHPETIRFPSSYLIQTATNVCLNMIRKEKKRIDESVDPILIDIATEEEFTEKLGINDLLEGIFNQEPSSTRSIATMLFVDNMTLEQTAQETGMSISGIQKRIRKFKAKLAKYPISEVIQK